MNSQQEIIINRYFTKHFTNFHSVLQIYEQVFLFKFNKSWIDADMEGKLYVFKCKDLKNLFFVIFHKKQVKNFVIEIKKGFRIDIKDNFVIIGEEAQKEYFGLWFNNKEEAVYAYNIFKRYNHS